MKSAYQIIRRPVITEKGLGVKETEATLVFEVDCINVWNKVTMNGPAVSVGASNFGQIGGASGNARDFQFAGHINF